MMYRVKQVGGIGVNKDLSAHELPVSAWTDSRNIRFLDGMAKPFYGHGSVYGTPSETPQYVMPVTISGQRYWIYATATKTYCVTISGGAAVETDLTHATPRTGVVNQWTGTLLSGIPILNSGDTSKIPMSWDLNTANNFVDLVNWPANTYCKSLRSFKNFLVALNVTKSGTNYPFMVKWGSPADPGALPSTWDESDTTADAGETDLGEGSDVIIDGLPLRDFFMIYRESSCWRMEYIGGPFVFRFSKVLGVAGAMNRNCIAECDGFHVVLTGSDVIVHDGMTSSSVLDKETRRHLFQNISAEYSHLCFVFKNPFFNEVFVCYPSPGATVCDASLVWNYVDKTVSFRDMPSANHANYGPIDNGLVGSWDADSDPWDSDLSLWDGPDIVPSVSRVLLASSQTKLYMLDSSSSFDGVLPTTYIERRGLTLDAPERMKIVRGIRPRITGNVGDTVIVKVGVSDDPYASPEYVAVMTHTIGATVSNDCTVSGRYIAIRFEGGTAYQWRLDSYDIDYVDGGER